MNISSHQFDVVMDKSEIMPTLASTPTLGLTDLSPFGRHSGRQERMGIFIVITHMLGILLYCPRSLFRRFPEIVLFLSLTPPWTLCDKTGTLRNEVATPAYLIYDLNTSRDVFTLTRPLPWPSTRHDADRGSLISVTRRRHRNLLHCAASIGPRAMTASAAK